MQTLLKMWNNSPVNKITVKHYSIKIKLKLLTILNKYVYMCTQKFNYPFKLLKCICISRDKIRKFIHLHWSCSVHWLTVGFVYSIKNGFFVINGSLYLKFKRYMKWLVFRSVMMPTHVSNKHFVIDFAYCYYYQMSFGLLPLRFTDFSLEYWPNWTIYVRAWTSISAFDRKILFTQLLRENKSLIKCCL